VNNSRIRSAFSRTFLWHYVEMVIAMYAGMAIIGLSLQGLLSAMEIETATWEQTVPALLLLEMAVIMTAPMMAWMRFRGHSWRASWEMGASMFVPTFGAIALLATGIVTDYHSLMGIEHLAMFPSMLAAMLLRPEEYAGHDHHRAPAHATS
jgi:hypothetical protein